MIVQRLEQLLQTCTVRLSTGSSQGTGFFVAPGLIVTCAHVVELAQSKPITVFWPAQQQTFTATVLDCQPDPNIDLALLSLTVPFPDHPCVLLDESMPQLGDRLYSFGYPQDNPDGDPVTAGFEGESFRGTASLHKLKGGQFNYGSSGSPLLNCRTGSVCGVVAISRNVSTDLGARAIPAWVMLTQFPQLRDANRQFHQTHLQWTLTALSDRSFLKRRVLAGAIGAGVALGGFRAAIAPIFNLSAFVLFFHNFWGGAVLGAALTYGMVWAEWVTLSWQAGWVGAIAIETACFGLAHLLLAIIGGSLLTQAPLVAPLGFVAGTALSCAVYNMGKLPLIDTALRASPSSTLKQFRLFRLLLHYRWFGRLGFVALVFAFIQSIFLITDQGTGLVMVWTSQMYEAELSRYTNLPWWAAFIQRYPFWFDYLSIADSALVGVMLAIGLKTGWQFANNQLIKERTELRRWRLES